MRNRRKQLPRKEGKGWGSSRGADPAGDGPLGRVQWLGLVQRDAEHPGGMLHIQGDAESSRQHLHRGAEEVRASRSSLLVPWVRQSGPVVLGGLGTRAERGHRDHWGWFHSVALAGSRLVCRGGCFPPLSGNFSL